MIDVHNKISGPLGAQFTTFDNTLLLKSTIPDMIIPCEDRPNLSL